MPRGTRLEVAENETAATGERLELLAVVRGLEALPEPARITLVTGSDYVRRGIRFGLEEWRANNWQWERFGEWVPVKNLDLWRRIDRALAYHTVELKYWRVDPAHSPAVSNGAAPTSSAKPATRFVHVVERGESAQVAVTNVSAEEQRRDILSIKNVAEIPTNSVRKKPESKHAAQQSSGPHFHPRAVWEVGQVQPAWATVPHKDNIQQAHRRQQPIVNSNSHQRTWSWLRVKRRSWVLGLHIFRRIAELRQSVKWFAAQFGTPLLSKPWDDYSTPTTVLHQIPLPAPRMANLAVKPAERTPATTVTVTARRRNFYPNSLVFHAEP